MQKRLITAGREIGEVLQKSSKDGKLDRSSNTTQTEKQSLAIACRFLLNFSTNVILFFWIFIRSFNIYTLPSCIFCFSRREWMLIEKMNTLTASPQGINDWYIGDINPLRGRCEINLGGYLDVFPTGNWWVNQKSSLIFIRGILFETLSNTSSNIHSVFFIKPSTYAFI